MAEDFMSMYKQALERLSTGGQSLEASLQEIEEGKKQAIAGGQQALVSGGMGGTTVMGGVPLQAEKIASRQRLGARGRAEEKYLTTLASFAAFAQQGEEAQKQRVFETQMAQYRARQTGASNLQRAQLQYEQTQREQRFGAEQAEEQRKWETEERLQTEWAERRAGGAGGTQAQQFPSLYDQTGASAPSLMDAATPTAATPTAATPTAGAPTAGAGGGYEIDSGFYGGGYAPQTGDYMSVAGGAGGPIMGGGATTSFGGAAQPSAGRDTSQQAYQAAKAAGRPWTYNYGTWKRAVASGKT